MKLIPVKYHKKDYPSGIIAHLIEVAGNFDSKQLCINESYSLHTEYSYMKRSYMSELLDGLDEIKNSHKNGIPQLWKSIKWSEEFVLFIKRLVGKSNPPEVIEIHPPFREYCDDINTFWERYLVFYKGITASFPETKILIENRCGTMYSGSKFLFSTCADLVDLCIFLSKGHKELGVIIDYPQLFSAEKIKMDNLDLKTILAFNKSIAPYKSTVGAIHLWGKRKGKNSNRWAAHSGDLNTFFSYDIDKKNTFLSSIKNTFNDDIERYFVPEVNTSEEDLKSIVNDIVSNGISFIQNPNYSFLISIDWSTNEPRFVLGTNNSTLKKKAIGKFVINVGKKKYCIGNKDVKSHEFLGCPKHTQLFGKAKKCLFCERNDLLKYCVRCRGDYCYSNNQDVLERCNQKHFLYLTFFPHDIIKVGIAHYRRKYERLYEQGALFSLIVASASSGKAIRQLESFIRDLGIKDKVTSKQKINNISGFDLLVAEKMLYRKYNEIINQIKQLNLKGFELIIPPEKVTRPEVFSLLSEVKNDEPQQLTLWDNTEYESINDSYIEVLDDFCYFEGDIICFIGSIAILKKGKKKYLYDFKRLYGKEISILES